MTSQTNTSRWIAIFGLTVALIMPGCTTGLFKPVQPWYAVDSYQQVTPNQNNTANQSQTTAAPVRSQSSAQPKHESNVANNNDGELNQNSGSATKTSSWLDESIETRQVQTPPNQQQASQTPRPPVQTQSIQQQPIQSPPAGQQPFQTGQIQQQPILSRASERIPVQTPITNSTFNSTNTPSRPALIANPQTSTAPFAPQIIRSSQGSSSTGIIPSIERGQPIFSSPIQNSSQPAKPQIKSQLFFGQPTEDEPAEPTTTFFRAQSPEQPIQIPAGGSGAIPQFNPLFQSNPQTLTPEFPQNFADLDIFVSETSTGRINFGGAFNSDSGLVGQFVVDERNFDLFRLPRNFREIVDGTAFRGGGQNFRLELVPGSDVERYLVSFSEPFLGGSRVSFSSSLYYFQRQFFDYDSERLGGRFALGYRLTPDLSVSTSIRLENVEISDARNATSPQLNAVLGDTDLFVGNVGLIRDTRDHPFLPTEGTFTSLTFSQAFGEFDYSRGDIDFRTYRLIYQRPDFSGRHTLSYSTRVGFTGSQTPVFENYFAGGFSTLRGFDFRGASPIEGDIRVGGEFQWLNSIEYTFPITADDMVKGVLFTDFGTVEQNIELQSENFRVAPGFGFRVHLPAAGIGAPLAFDFAFPVSDAEGDEQQQFSFYLGVNR